MIYSSASSGAFGGLGNPGAWENFVKVPSDMVGYALTELSQKPEWLEALLTDRFFDACSSHLDLKKNETNVFCINCSRGLCQHCLTKHRSHRLLQVRRYVYHDVIRLQDIQKLVECSYVQTYIINSARVVFLKQRPQSRPAKGFSNSCRNCERSLQESYRYCCISCKVESALRLEGADAAVSARRAAKSSSSCMVAHRVGSTQICPAEPICPDSVLEGARFSSASSGSASACACVCAPSASAASSDVNKADVALTSTAATTTTLTTALYTGPALDWSRKTKRRKGVPQRSPIY